MRAFEFINRPEALRELTRRLEDSDRFAVDTEADSLYSYFDKVCLFQFTLAGSDYVVDPLAMPREEVLCLGEALRRPDVEKVLHAAEYDVLCLRRDYGFEIGGIFDTMIACQLIGYERFGLADVLETQFGVVLDKRFQRAPWSRRPLSEEMLEYARLDTHYLLDLRDRLSEELERLGRTHWAREEFDLIAARRWPKRREFSADGFRKLKGASRLTPRQRAVLKSLYVARDTRARELDRPPFKIVGNAALVEIARRQPRTEEELLQVVGVTPLVARRCAPFLLEAVEEGLRAPLPEPAGPPNRKGYDPRVKARVKRLKQWRRTRAKDYGIQPHVLVPNSVIEALGELRPVTRRDLESLEGMRKWMMDEIGDDLVSFANDDLAHHA